MTDQDVWIQKCAFAKRGIELYYNQAYNLFFVS